MKDSWVIFILVFFIFLARQVCWSSEDVLCDQIFSKNSGLKSIALTKSELKLEKQPLLARALQGYMMASFEKSGQKWMLILRDQNLVLSPARDLHNQVSLIQPWQDLQLNPNKGSWRIEAQIQDQILTVTIDEAQLSEAKLIQAKVIYNLEKLLLGRTDQAQISTSKTEAPFDSDMMASALSNPETFHFPYQIRTTKLDWNEVRRDDKSVEYQLSFSKDGSSEKVYSSSFFLPVTWSILQFHRRSEYSRPDKFLLYLLAKTPQGLQSFALFTKSYVE